MTINILQKLLKLFVGACVIVTGLTTATLAATITVTNTANSGPGTLRDALASVADGDTINIITNGTILLVGELVVSNSVTISGPGPANLAVDGNESYRVFRITTNLVVTISGLTIANGQDLSGTGGGGIYNRRSTLTVSNCVLSGNTAVSIGGAIYNEGISGSATVTVVNSTISGNRAGHGGAIWNDGSSSGSASLTIVNSTVSGNSATRVGSAGGAIDNFADFGRVTLEITTSTLSSNTADDAGAIMNETDHGNVTVRISRTTISGNSASNSRGGGVYNIPFFGIVSLQITNSTFSGNSCPLEGGAIYSAPYQGTTTVQIANCTFSGNSASDGGAIYNTVQLGVGTATLAIGSTILNAGPSGGTISNDNGTVTSLGYNLSSDGGGAVLTNATDQINTDPQLGPLANNGGPTPTHALLPGSPAIDKGKSFSLTTDQRGFPRTVNDPCLANAAGGDGSDIGALETQAVCADFKLTAITRESGNIRLAWQTVGGVTNIVQFTNGDASGGFTNNFTDLATNFISGVGLTTTNHLDTGAALFTNRYYRVRLVP